jgi:mono/diheme cytochrome c family protein
MRLLATCLVCVLVVSSARAAEPVDYLREIKPVLTKHCYSCHGAEKQKAGLRLDTAAAALKGGNTGPAIIPGKPADSLIMHALTGTKDAKVMPPREPRLTREEIARVEAWIAQGAKAPADEKGQTGKSVVKHWSFQPVTHPKPPEVKNAAWVRNSIDNFILARLEKEQLAPAAEADRVTLIRRLSLDLLGLPPTPAEVDAFVNDKSPDAYEKLVDRLLKSPHYGERWGRHWLDLARYADSNGFTIDGPRAIWRYRDWVIDAFNRDLPFDQFAVEQLAGDLLPDATLDQKVATGFHRNTLRNEEGGIDVEQFRVESIVDRVNTTGAVFLGLTVGCCQCHDHKFDPLSQREYYQLFAFLNNADEPTLELGTPEEIQRRNVVRKRSTALDNRRKTLDRTTLAQQLKWENGLPKDVRANLPPEIRKLIAIAENGRTPEEMRTLMTYFRTLDMAKHAVGGLANPNPFISAAHANALAFRLDAERELTELKKIEPNIVTSLVMQERKTPRKTNVMIQGDFTRKGVEVGPGTLGVLHPFKSVNKQANRLDLARWIIDPSNPLTSRVTMNRFWQHYFGLGIVETENDFGTQGTAPSHPELLDWLASEFIARKWSMKAMHRLIVTSATYRQSSAERGARNAKASEASRDPRMVDPRNRLLYRQNRLRLEAEIVRDVSLAASGLLSRDVGGPGVYPPQPDGVYRFTQINKNWKADVGARRYRRGMYTYFWRSAPHPSLTVFDAPDGNSTCTRRNRSNTPLQALTLLNDQASFEFAQGLAARIMQEKKDSDAERLRDAFRLLFARQPSDFELKRLLDLLARQRAGLADTPDEARQIAPKDLPVDVNVQEFASWTMVARVMLNLDEFITRE